MSTAETLQLLKSLEPKLGEKSATDLITFIEGYKHHNLATKADLKDLEIRLRKEIKDSSDELRKDINELRKDMNANTWKILGGIAALRYCSAFL